MRVSESKNTPCETNPKNDSPGQQVEANRNIRPSERRDRHAPVTAWYAVATHAKEIHCERVDKVKEVEGREGWRDPILSGRTMKVGRLSPR